MYSQRPTDDGNTLLVEGGLIVAAINSQTHNELLSGSIQVDWDHHLVALYTSSLHLSGPSHQHGRETLADFFLLSDGHNDIAIRPVSTLDSESCHEEAFIIDLLSSVLLHVEFQFFQ